MNAVALNGFTLVEMLVTLVVLSMISSLLWQALQQTAVVERLLQSAGNPSQLLMVRREWLRNLIESALPEQQNAAPGFQGDTSGLKLASAESLGLPGMGGGMLQIRLHHDASQRRNRLTLEWVQPKGYDTPVAAPITLLNWIGEPGRLTYLDSAGAWHDEWPLPKALVKLLPTAVRIDLGVEAGGTLFAAVAVTAIPRPRLVDWQQQ